MKLMLCAGDRVLPGFITHDVQGKHDIVCDLMDIEKHIKADSCEEVYFTHALEHFPTKEVPKVLDMVYRIARSGAPVTIEVPNFKWHAELVMSGRDRDAVYYAFGGQLDQYDFHKTAFTEKILREELEDAGFTDINIIEASSLTAKFKKP